MSRELPAESSPLQEKAPLVRMYCHLLLQPGSCTLEAHKCEDNFRSFSKGCAELPPPSVEGCFRQQIDAARCSVITGRIPGRVKVVFVFFFFGLIIAHTARQGGGGFTIHLYLPLSQGPASPGHHHSHSAGWLLD